MSAPDAPRVVINLDKLIEMLTVATAQELPAYLRAIRKAAIAGAKSFAKSPESEKSR